MIRNAFGGIEDSYQTPSLRVTNQLTSKEEAEHMQLLS